jgi:mRNA interferase HicA
VKRSDLVQKIKEAAAAADVDFGKVREGGKHTIYRCGSQRVVVPRHREINELTARGIMDSLEDELGSGWWK